MMMSNSHCGPDIVKYFVVEPANDVVTGATGNFFVCSGTTFLSTISGCTNSVDFNGNTFYNNSDVFFNGVITACTGIHTSNIYGCSPITVNDELILLSGLTLNNISQDNSLVELLARDGVTGEVKYINFTGITEDNALENVLGRDNITGELRFRSVESIISAATSQDTFVTGSTLSGNTLVLSRNDGVDLTTDLSGIAPISDLGNVLFVTTTGDDSTGTQKVTYINHLEIYTPQKVRQHQETQFMCFQVHGHMIIEILQEIHIMVKSMSWLIYGKMAYLIIFHPIVR